MTPAENGQLLDAAAAASDAPEGDYRRLFEAKRDIVTALAQRPVLVAVRDRRPVPESGPTGGVVVAFTDAEAGRAWLADRHPAAPDVELARSDAVLSGGVPTVERWHDWLAALPARALVLNPAGPFGCLLYDEELRRMRPRLFPRGDGTGAHPWLDPQARAAERARGADVLARLGAAARASDGAALQHDIGSLRRFGSLLWSAELQYLHGLWRLGRGVAADELHQMIYGSLGWGRFGDPHRSIDGLLEAAGALAALDPETRRASWADNYRREIAAALEWMRIGYRDAEIDALVTRR